MGLIAALGCPQKQPALLLPAEAGVDAGAVTAGIDAGIPDGGGAPSTPAALPGLGLVARWDGGQADLLGAPDASVAPLSDFVLSTSAVLADCRVRVLDDDDRMVPNHAAFRRGDGGSTVELALVQPLPSKHCCRFVVDGELGQSIGSADHHLYQPLQARFSVWQAPAAPETGLARRHHHRHRRRH
jgi:hypothetical protein